jgi:hypothetical protein
VNIVALTDRHRAKRVAVVIASTVAIFCAVPSMIALGWTDWPYAYAIAAIGSAAMLAAAWRWRDATLLHIWWFALVFGMSELAVDAWLVGSTRTLDYGPYASRGGPMWWASPAFMPLAWQVLVAHVATLTEAVSRWRAASRIAFAVILGAAYVPLGEELSIRAGFWLYRDVPKVSHVPLYIVLGEILLAVAVVALLPVLMRGRVVMTTAAGVLAAAALWTGYALGIALL